MMGPSPYLILSAILFGIGVAGVVARKNALIVLMSVEIMLNGVNAAGRATGSYLGDVTGAVFAFMVMTLAGAEGGCGPGGDSHGRHAHGDQAAPQVYRKLDSCVGPAVVGAAFVVSALSVLA